MKKLLLLIFLPFHLSAQITINFLTLENWTGDTNKLEIFFYLFDVIFLAYWCGTHKWAKFNNLAELSIFYCVLLLFFSYIFLDFVFRLYQALKPLESQNTNTNLEQEDDTIENAL